MPNTCNFLTTDVAVIEGWFDGLDLSSLSLIESVPYTQQWDASLTDKDSVCSEARLREILALAPDFPATQRNRKRLEDSDAGDLYTEFLPEGEFYMEGTGFFHYPPGGYIGWHTNSDRPGRRTYISCVEKTNHSFFRYYDSATDTVVTDWDTERVMVRHFDIPADGLFWHCVGSDTNRISLGMVDIR